MKLKEHINLTLRLFMNKEYSQEETRKSIMGMIFKTRGDWFFVGLVVGSIISLMVSINVFK